MRSKFDQQLALLNDELTQMGETCAKAICLAAQALEEQNASTAAPVAELEEQTNEQERSIEALCLSCFCSSSRSRVICGRFRQHSK